MTTLRIDVFDSTRREWRWFNVVPYDMKYVPKCGNGLHQFYPIAIRCACGSIDKVPEQGI